MLPKGARLNHKTFWGTLYKDKKQWIEITFNQAQYISGIITQGFLLKRPYYVKSYKVEYKGEENASWQYILADDGEQKVIEG